MNIILSDAGLHTQVLPLTYTRPVAHIRNGLFNNEERWQHYTEQKIIIDTEEYLRTDAKEPEGKNAKAHLWINAALLPDEDIAKEILALKKGSLVKNDTLLAAVISGDSRNKLLSAPEPVKEYSKDIVLNSYVWDYFANAAESIRLDMHLKTKGRKSAILPKTNLVIGDYPVFVEASANVKASIINAEKGPVYIGEDALVMEGAKIRGPFIMGQQSVIKMDAKIYGPTILGQHCKVGGELNNVVFLGYSNKAHDGFLGNSVIGEWCNLGADTNNSNLKNNYAPVKLFDYSREKFVNTGLQFCGLIMGDHSKCGINTMFNTGTVVGINCNIYGSGFPRNFIPSFSWGGAAGFKTYKLEKAFEVNRTVMARRGMELSHKDERVLTHVFEKTAVYRKD